MKPPQADLTLMEHRLEPPQELGQKRGVVLEVTYRMASDSMKLAAQESRRHLLPPTFEGLEKDFKANDTAAFEGVPGCRLERFGSKLGCRKRVVGYGRNIMFLSFLDAE
jgi:hypothetical protein